MRGSPTNKKRRKASCSVRKGSKSKSKNSTRLQTKVASSRGSGISGASIADVPMGGLFTQYCQNNPGLKKPSDEDYKVEDSRMPDLPQEDNGTFSQELNLTKKSISKKIARKNSSISKERKKIKNKLQPSMEKKRSSRSKNVTAKPATLGDLNLFGNTISKMKNDRTTITYNLPDENSRINWVGKAQEQLDSPQRRNQKVEEQESPQFGFQLDTACDSQKDSKASLPSQDKINADSSNLGSPSNSTLKSKQEKLKKVGAQVNMKGIQNLLSQIRTSDVSDKSNNEPGMSFIKDSLSGGLSKCPSSYGQNSPKKVSSKGMLGSGSPQGSSSPVQKKKKSFVQFLNSASPDRPGLGSSKSPDRRDNQPTQAAEKQNLASPNRKTSKETTSQSQFDQKKDLSLSPTNPTLAAQPSESSFFRPADSLHLVPSQAQISQISLNLEDRPSFSFQSPSGEPQNQSHDETLQNILEGL